MRQPVILTCLTLVLVISAPIGLVALTSRAAHSEIHERNQKELIPYIITGKSLRLRINLAQIMGKEEDRLLVPPGIKTPEKEEKFVNETLPVGTIVLLEKECSSQNSPFCTFEKRGMSPFIRIKGILVDPFFYGSRGLAVPDFKALAISPKKINNWIRENLSVYIAYSPRYMEPLRGDLKIVLKRFQKLLENEPGISSTFQRELCEEYFPRDYLIQTSSNTSKYNKMYNRLRTIIEKRGSRKLSDEEMIDQICGADILGPENLYERYQNVHRSFCSENIYLFAAMKLSTQLSGKKNTKIYEAERKTIKKRYLNYIAENFDKDEFSEIILALTAYGEARQLKGIINEDAGYQMVAEMTTVMQTIKNRKDSERGFEGPYTKLLKQKHLEGSYAGIALNKEQYSLWNTTDKETNMLSTIVHYSPYATELAFAVTRHFLKGTFLYGNNDTGRNSHRSFTLQDKNVLHYHAPGITPKWSEGKTPISTPIITFNAKDSDPDAIIHFKPFGKTYNIDLSSKMRIKIKYHIFYKDIALN